MRRLIKFFVPAAFFLLVGAMPVSDGFAQVTELYGFVNGTNIKPDSVPEYPGGEAAMFKAISSLLRFPSDALEDGAQGKLLLSFIIDEAGNLTELKVETGVHPALNAEALRVVKQLQVWKPAYSNGKPVKYRKVLPVKFYLR